MNRHAYVVAAAFLVVLGSGCATQQTAGDGRYDASAMTADRPDTRQYVPSANLPDIHFDFDKYEIRSDAARTLDSSAKWLKSNTKALVLIEGHADERGTTEYNLSLGERRAKAAVSYLVSQGVDARRFAVVSFGEDKPQCQQHNAACWAKNRRAHFLFKSE
jgi:peptidoglycan-associated lipoprotein